MMKKMVLNELLMKKIPIKSAGMHRYIIGRENLEILDNIGLKYTIEKETIDK